MIFTIGHSTLEPSDFVALLAGVDAVVDVRSYPGSRRVPHFSREQMEVWLPEAGVAYEWRPELGGRRRLPPGVDAGASRWRVAAFEAYAWHTASDAWLGSVESLIERAAEPVGGVRPGAEQLALMCAESLWWRCHRSLIADYLVWRGVEAVHLQPERTLHSRAVGDRLERFPDAVVESWRGWFLARG